MTAEQARFLADIFLEELEMEMATTRRVLAAVPNDKGAYSPHPKSKDAFSLASHLASADVMFLNGVAALKFGGGAGMPEDVKTPADVVAWYDAHRGPALAKVKAMSAEQLATPVDFHGVMNLPAVRFLNLSVRHAVHHRGQLAAYLRPMGAKVPSIFGPSADEERPA